MPIVGRLMLSVRQSQALQALLTHPSKAEAAKAAHVAPRTLSKYLADPEFQAEYRKAVDELIGDASDSLKVSMSPAIKTLHDICADELEPSSTRISAAKSLRDFGLKYTELFDVIRELREFEGGF